MAKIVLNQAKAKGVSLMGAILTVCKGEGCRFPGSDRARSDPGQC